MLLYSCLIDQVLIVTHHWRINCPHPQCPLLSSSWANTHGSFSTESHMWWGESVTTVENVRYWLPSRIQFCFIIIVHKHRLPLVTYSPNNSQLAENGRMKPWYEMINPQMKRNVLSKTWVNIQSVFKPGLEFNKGLATFHWTYRAYRSKFKSIPYRLDISKPSLFGQK